MIVRLFEFVLLVSMLVVIVTQIIIPFSKNSRLFPSFRKTGTLENKLAEANQELSNAKLVQDINKVKHEVEMLETQSKD
jgi:cell division protein FtsL